MPRTLSTALPGHECIRVVPLYQPQIQQAIAANLTYRGGALVEAAKVFAIFWGQSWADDADAKDLSTAMNKFFPDILLSSLIDQLSEYNVPGKAIGHGSFIGSTAVTADAPKRSVSDSRIQTALQNWISNGTAPQNDKDTIYFVFLERGSSRTAPVNQSVGPLFEGCDPLLLISMLGTSLLRVQRQHFSGIRSPVCASSRAFRCRC